MTPKQWLKHGSLFPYDASDSWWEKGGKPPPSASKAHTAARGVIAELQDRRGIKHGFDGIDEELRKEIVETLAQIIREAMED